jgi:hypothetical protein
MTFFSLANFPCAGPIDVYIHNFPLSFQPAKTLLMVFCCFLYRNFYDIFITYICSYIGFGLVIDCVMCSSTYYFNSVCYMACMHIANLLALFNGGNFIKSVIFAFSSLALSRLVVDDGNDVDDGWKNAFCK